MQSSEADRAFSGSIPQLYEQYLVPLIFEPYAVDLSRRIMQLAPARVLEIAAGTGVVTRHLARVLSPDTAIIASDLNQPMLDHAAALGTEHPVQWRQADAMQLPFPDEYFDVVVCQFGVMFFPDKAKAFLEARRVLRTGGMLLFNVWDGLEENDFPCVVDEALETLFPNDPPHFMRRVPHGYFDTEQIAQDLARGGFTRAPAFTTVTKRSRANSARVPAVAFCQGTPLRNEIAARGTSSLDEATDIAAAAIASRYGSSAVEGRIQAHVVMIEK